MARSRREDLEFMADVKASASSGPRLGASLLLFAITAFVVVAVLWASRAPLDEVTSGLGRVVPSSQIQVIQNLEGGIVSQILVREGQTVQKGQVLLRIDDTSFAATFRENQARYFAFLAKVQRLQAEIEGRPPVYPKAIKSKHPNLAASETAHYRARQAELNSALQILGRHLDQRKQELVEAANRIKKLRQGLMLAQEELKIQEPMVKAGVTSKVEILRLRRQVNELEGNLEATQLSLPRIKAAVAAVRHQRKEKQAAFRSAARSELNETRVRLAVLKEALTAVEDRVRRTEVRSSVHGIVKSLAVSTIGGVVSPGMELLQIVPLEDNLFVEAEILPSDIAFLSPGQKAKVKITAYDFGDYGGLDGRLEHISADTIVDETGQSFYQIRVRTKRNYLGTEKAPLPIIPGMVAEVDILTGKRTVLEYFLKPVLRAQQKALTER